MESRIMTPNEVSEASDPLFHETLKRVNSALVKGQRMFFSGTMKDESYIPPGCMTRIKSALEKAGWFVRATGGSMPNVMLDVFTPEEKKLHK